MTAPCTEKDTLARIEKKIDSISETLNGNGKTGLKTQISLHRAYFKIVAALGAPILIGLTVRAIWAYFVK